MIGTLLDRARTTQAARLDRERSADEARLLRLTARMRATTDQLQALDAQARLQDRALDRARNDRHLPGAESFQSDDGRTQNRRVEAILVSTE